MAASKGMYLAYLFQALIAVEAAIAFLTGQYDAMFTAILMFGVTFVPYVIADRLDVRLPWFVYFLIALSLSLHIAGYVQGWYLTYYPYYDKAAHMVSGISIALIGFLGVIFLDRYRRMNLTPLFVVFFTVIFGMAIGGFWEIYEFAVDQIFGNPRSVPMQIDLADTMWDMIADLAGSLIVSIGAILYFRYHYVDEIGESMDGNNRA
jgi:uncharacterized membrane protein YjdF